MITEPVAHHLRDHQTTLNSRMWRYAHEAAELHRWIPLLDFEFKLNLPSYPVLKFASIRNAYATYASFRDESGVKDVITFNNRELARSAPLRIRTLAHELIHLWQQYHGTPSKSNFHNLEYREKARVCGLTVTEWGCTTGHTQAFTDLLAKHGINLKPMASETSLYGARQQSHKMKKWVCQCEPKPTIVRCATTLDAICNRCSRAFMLA